MEIRGCKGCWGCWVRTPGECVQSDDSADVCRAVLGSDLTLFASPMRMGFVSALLKRATDKLIPLVHPYLVIEGGEMHHRARYDRYPQMGLLLGAAEDIDAEDIDITREIWERTARNRKTRLIMTAVADRPAEEVADELVAVA
jgi:multimeric flavodoxin WrbA